MQEIRFKPFAGAAGEVEGVQVGLQFNGPRSPEQRERVMAEELPMLAEAAVSLAEIVAHWNVELDQLGGYLDAMELMRTGQHARRVNLEPSAYEEGISWISLVVRDVAEAIRRSESKEVKVLVQYLGWRGRTIEFGVRYRPSFNLDVRRQQ